MLEGWSGVEESGRDGLDDEPARTLESVSSLELVTMVAMAIW